jgi:hypothetical protein
MAEKEKETETVVLDEEILKEIVEREEQSDPPGGDDSRLVRLDRGAESSAEDQEGRDGEKTNPS